MRACRSAPPRRPRVRTSGSGTISDRTGLGFLGSVHGRVLVGQACGGAEGINSVSTAASSGGMDYSPGCEPGVAYPPSAELQRSGTFPRACCDTEPANRTASHGPTDLQQSFPIWGFPRLVCRALFGITLRSQRKGPHGG